MKSIFLSSCLCLFATTAAHAATASSFVCTEGGTTLILAVEEQPEPNFVVVSGGTIVDDVSTVSQQQTPAGAVFDADAPNHHAHVTITQDANGNARAEFSYFGTKTELSCVAH